MSAQVTILPQDRPLGCSRCGGPLAEKTPFASWNGVLFGVCSDCTRKQEEAERAAR